MRQAWVSRFHGGEDGQSLVEYALITALAAVVLVVGLTALGPASSTPSTASRRRSNRGTGFAWSLVPGARILGV